MSDSKHNELRQQLEQFDATIKIVDELKMAIGETVRALREANGLTYVQTAHLIDADPSNISKLEKGKVWARPMVDAILEKLK